MLDRDADKRAHRGLQKQRGDHDREAVRVLERHLGHSVRVPRVRQPRHNVARLILLLQVAYTARDRRQLNIVCRGLHVVRTAALHRRLLHGQQPGHEQDLGRSHMQECDTTGRRQLA